MGKNGFVLPAAAARANAEGRRYRFSAPRWPAVLGSRPFFDHHPACPVLTRFRPGLWPTLTVLAALLLTVNLGFWQLRRAAEKQALLDGWQQAMQGPALSIGEAAAYLDSGKPIKAQVQGRWLPEPLVVWENRRLDERQGMQFLQWLETDAGLLLIDRGWSAVTVAPASGEASVSGQLLQPESPWRRPVLSVQDGVIRTPVLDMPALAELAPAGKTTLNYLLRLHGDSEAALAPVGHQHPVMPVRHYGYAVTWFGLSLAILLLFIKWSWRKSEVHERD